MIDPYNEKLVPYITGKNKTFWTFTSTSLDSKTSFKFLGDNDITDKTGQREFKKGTIFTLLGKVWDMI